jgi:alkylated DNA repair dioxygenase AlkB
MARMQQPSLFDTPDADAPETDAPGAHPPGTPALPTAVPGLQHAAGFLSTGEEAALLQWIATLPFEAAVYKAYTARRRIVSYGGRYDYDEQRLKPAPPLPHALLPLRQRLAAWAGLHAEAYTHALVAEYPPGTPLGWHRDVPDFEHVAGVSLAGHARMRWRRYPPAPHAEVLTLELAPRSAYLLQGAARWEWQHSIAPTDELRYSITLRTRRGR